MRFLLIRTTQGVTMFQRTTPRRMRSPFSPPMDLLYVAGVLEQAGHTAKVLDFACEHHPLEATRRALTGSDAVILSVMPGNVDASRDLAGFIRDNDAGLPVILQGPHCRIRPEHVLQEIPAAQISINGEAEFLINDVLCALAGQRPLAAVPGISYRDHDQVKSGPPAIENRNLDSLPYPARHLVAGYDYGRFNGVYLTKPRFTSMLTSRGCPFHCRFCTTHVHSPAYRKRSSDNVIGEFRDLPATYGSVLIEDSNFLADLKRTAQILDGIIADGVIRSLYIFGARVDTADRGLYQKMRRAGVRFISYGLESGSQQILDYYRKRITLQQSSNAVALAAEMGFITWGSFILGAPHETADHIRQTTRFAASLPLDIVYYRTLAYQTGSDLWDEAVKHGTIAEDDDPYILADAGRNLSPFTAARLASIGRRATHAFYLRPHYLFRAAYRSLRRRDPTLMK